MANPRKTMMGRARKGQYFSFDAIIASIIFIIAISVLSSYWFGVRAVMDSRSENMYNEGIRISDMLMSEGTPTNWYANPATVQQYGLLANKSTYLLDNNKLGSLKSQLNVNYNQTRKKMGLDKYEIYIEIGNNTGAFSNGKLGYDPQTAGANPANIVTTSRTAVFKSSPTSKPMLATVRVILWTENFDN